MDRRNHQRRSIQHIHGEGCEGGGVDKLKVIQTHTLSIAQLGAGRVDVQRLAGFHTLIKGEEHAGQRKGVGAVSMRKPLVAA